MATAVSLWSPVIITGRTPAAAHRSTAARTSGRGGSIMPMSPTKISSRSSSWASRDLGGPLWLRWATASTRRALAARSLPTPRMRRRSASVMGRGPWGPCTWVQRESTASGAPFTAMRVPPAGRLWQVAIRLRTESKGASPWRGMSRSSWAFSSPSRAAIWAMAVSVGSPT